MNLNNKVLESLVNEVNQSWSEIPVKYDDFLEFYRLNSPEGSNSDQEAVNMAKFKTALVFALTQKDLPTPDPANISLDEAFKAQTISEDHIDEMINKVNQMEAFNETLEEGNLALETVLERNQTDAEKQDENEKFLKKIKIDFMKQQRRLTGVIQKVFEFNYEAANRLLSMLFDAHFEDVNKFINIPANCNEIVEILMSADLIVINPKDCDQLKLRQTL